MKVYDRPPTSLNVRTRTDKLRAVERRADFESDMHRTAKFVGHLGLNEQRMVWENGVYHGEATEKQVYQHMWTLLVQSCV